jgi:hypothetical protein
MENFNNVGKIENARGKLKKVKLNNPVKKFRAKYK